MSLTPKQRRFVEEYCGGARFNAAEAARRAGYSEQTARAIGHENLTKPDIKAAVAARLDELSMSAEEATRRLTEWGAGSLAPFLRITASGDVRLDLSTAEAQAQLHLIKKLKITEHRTTDDKGVEHVEARAEVELYDAKDATVQLARIRGLYVDRHEHSGPDGGAVQVEVSGARERVAGRLAGIASRVHTNGTSPSANGRGHASP